MKKYQFSELIDIPNLQELTDELYQATSVPSALIALDGKLLTRSGGQRICMDFHHKHPQAHKECTESCTKNIKEMSGGIPFFIYECPRGLIDASAPVIIEGEHVANVLTGQIFTEPPDAAKEQAFREQAGKFGFDEEDYIAAFREIPVFPQNKLRIALSFLVKSAEFIASLGLARIRELEAVEHLRDNERKHRSLLESTNAVPWELDLATQEFTYVGPQSEKILGYAATHWKNLDSWAQAVHQDDREAALSFFLSETALGKDHDFEYRMITKDGREIWIHDVVSVIHGPQGPVRVVGFMRDITHAKVADEALRESEERFRALFEQTGDYVLILEPHDDGSLLIIGANEAACKIHGYSHEEIIGKPISLLDPYSDKSIHLERGKRLRSGETLVFESTHRRKDGSAFCAEVSAKQVHMAGKNPFYFTVEHDITERKLAEEEHRKLEAQVQQAQKLESLGVLAGGIAHDFNNLLMAILGNADLALVDLPETSSIRPMIQEIDTVARRAAELCTQMLAYSGKGRFLVKPLNLSQVIEEMGRMLAISVSKKVLLDYDLHRDLPSVVADASQLRQIIMNLVINASEAIGEKGGVVSINTGFLTCSREYLMATQLHGTIEEGDYVYLDVTDTGCGMDPSTVERIFDPFFTTKFTGRGLGLAAALGIVRGHGGRFESSERAR